MSFILNWLCDWKDVDIRTMFNFISYIALHHLIWKIEASAPLCTPSSTFRLQQHLSSTHHQPIHLQYQALVSVRRQLRKEEQLVQTLLNDHLEFPLPP